MKLQNRNYLQNKGAAFKGGLSAPPKPKFGGKVGMNAGVKQGKGAGATPAAPAAGIPASAVSPLNDAGYNANVNSTTREFNDTNLVLGNKEYGVKEQYGFDPQFAANPYTRANLLKRAADTRFRSTGNTMAARGQLYSGATSRARSADEFTAGAETDEARRSYNEALASIQAEKMAAQRARDTGMDTAYLAMIERAQEAEPDPYLFPQPPEAAAKKKPAPKKAPAAHKPPPKKGKK